MLSFAPIGWRGSAQRAHGLRNGRHEQHAVEDVRGARGVQFGERRKIGDSGPISQVTLRLTSHSMGQIYGRLSVHCRRNCRSIITIPPKLTMSITPRFAGFGRGDFSLRTSDTCGCARRRRCGWKAENGFVGAVYSVGAVCIAVPVGTCRGAIVRQLKCAVPNCLLPNCVRDSSALERFISILCYMADLTRS